VPDPGANYYSKDQYAALKHFRNKAGFFTNYSPVLLFNEYLQGNKTANEHIVKLVYRLGRNQIDNTRIAKVLVDSNFNVAKEFYDVRAVDDTSLFRKEFGKTVIYAIAEIGIINYYNVPQKQNK
jgi:hypothetical protein